MEPTRIDIKMLAGSDREFEWQLTMNGAPVNLDATGDSVFLYLASRQGRSYSSKLTSAAGSHYNGTSGKVRFKISRTLIPATAVNTQPRWYEVWRKHGSTGDEVPHFVGEIQVIPTSKI